MWRDTKHREKKKISHSEFLSKKCDSDSEPPQLESDLWIYFISSQWPNNWWHWQWVTCRAFSRITLVISRDSPLCLLSEQYTRVAHSHGILAAEEHCSGFKKNKKLGSSAYNSNFKVFQTTVTHGVTQRYFWVTLYSFRSHLLSS